MNANSMTLYQMGSEASQNGMRMEESLQAYGIKGGPEAVLEFFEGYFGSEWEVEYSFLKGKFCAKRKDGRR